MKNISQLVFTILVLISASLYSQKKDYNEEEVRKLLDKYIENPKLYYEKIKTLNERAEKANENAMKVSEEYLSLLDKKDSLIKIYKSKAIMASRVAPTPATSSTNTTPITTGSVAKPSQQTATIVTKVAGKTEHTPYRVQLAAYFRDDFEKFFGNFNKTLGIQKLNNRNVIEVQGFKDEAEALEFSQKIQKLGFPGAFVTKYDENGERQEGFKTDTKMFSSDPQAAKSSSTQTPAPRSAKNAQYPDYIPIGYKELMQKKSEPVAVKSPSVSTTPATPTVAPKSKTTESVQLRAPVIQRDAIISSTPSPPPQVNKPKNLASSAAPLPSSNESAAKPVVAPSPPPKQTNTPPPPVNKNTREQLDAAFDQLFKR